MVTAATSDPTSGRGRRPTLASRPHWLRALLSRRMSPDVPAFVRYIDLLFVLAGAALVVTTASIHLHLWLAGYRHVPTLGALFLAQCISGFIVGPIIALVRRAFVVLGGAVYMASSAIGLILSATVGFVGIHDGLNVPWATPSLVVEIAGFVLLAGGGLGLLYRN